MDTKSFVVWLCHSNGILYDLKLCTGHISPADDCSDLGASSVIVMKLDS